MHYRTKALLIVVAGFLAFYAIGMRESRGSVRTLADHLTVAASSVTYVLCCLSGILALRAIELVEEEKKQFALVLLATGAFAAAFVGLRAILPNDALATALFGDLPKMALVVPLLWIASKEKQLRKAAIQQPSQPTPVNRRG